MGWLFGKKNKASEDLAKLEKIHHDEVPMKVLLNHINKKDEKLTDPHNHHIPESLLLRTKYLWDDVHKSNPLKYDIHIKVKDEGVIYLNGLESIARLRALRSTNKTRVSLIQDR